MIVHKDATNKRVFKRLETLEQDLYKLHGDNLCFIGSVYEGVGKKITYWCNTHKMFYAAKACHLIAGIGCPDCGHDRRVEVMKERSKEKFKKEVKRLHPTLDFSGSNYKDSLTKITYFCKIHRGFYTASPSNLISGRGCLICSSSGFKPSKPAILYYIRVETRNQLLYKIGVTNKTVKERFSTGADMRLITTLKEEYFELGQDAYVKEQSILKEFKEFQYKGDPVLTAGGNTELFTRDILGLDKNSINRGEDNE